MDVCLNLNEYSYDDLLRLFKLPPQYTEAELRDAKRIVARVHPDKSGLDSTYFRFFNEAYKTLWTVHETKHRKVSLMEIQEENPTIAKFSRDADFGQKFNVLFEKYYVRDNAGCGEWLKAEGAPVSYEARKREARALTTTLVDSVGSSVFTPSSLGEEEYTSVEHVYTVGSVIGVSEVDHTEPPRTLKSVMDARAVLVTPMDRATAEDDLKRRGHLDDQSALRRIHSLVKQQEMHALQRKKFEGHIFQLTEF
jgi:hypothetical protein